MTEGEGLGQKLLNDEVRKRLEPLSAHSDVVSELMASLKSVGEYECHHGPLEYAAPCMVTHNLAFCAAVGMSEVHWRLRQSDLEVALSTGGEPSELGGDWVKFVLFRTDWPRPDLRHWALKAYDFARSDAQPDRVVEGRGRNRARDSVFWAWERLRLGYNGVLFLVAMVVFMLRYYSGQPPESGFLSALQTVAAFGLAANALFCVGPVVENYVRMFGWSERGWRGWVFGGGLVGSVILEVVVLGLVLTPF